jgi:redox-regulated HSP33 family molecular chaperone
MKALVPLLMDELIVGMPCLFCNEKYTFKRKH